MNEILLNWLRGGDTGSSSLTMAAIMENDTTIAAMNRWHGFHPRDPADLGRCIRLMEAMPEYRARLGEMAHVSQQWKVLVEHWDELETLYRLELPSGTATKTYQRMWDLLYPDHPRDWEMEEKAIRAWIEKE